MLLKELLLDLINQTDKDFKVIIQDNGENKVKKHIKEDIAGELDVCFLDLETNGLSESRNVCCQNCNTEYIHFLDDDVKISNNFVKNLKNKIKEIPNVAVIGGRVLPLFLNDPPDWITNSCLVYLSILDFGDKDLDFNPSEGISWLVGANLCFKLSKIKQYGFFKNYLGRMKHSDALLSGEENELVHKISESEKVIYSPNFTVYHKISKDRLKKEWFLKRAAWQGVTDVLTDQHWLSDLSDQENRLKSSLANILYNNHTKIDQAMHETHFLTYTLLK